MGITGPVPKHSTQKVRRNIDEVPIQTVTAIGVVPIPELNLVNPHPLVEDLYESMRHSAQAKFYEPSDWQYARVTLHFANNLLKSTKPSAMMLAQVNTMLTSLLLTEGDRRRVRIEVERKPDGSTPTGEVVTLADHYRASMERGE